jgi:hypothetical protein
LTLGEDIAEPPRDAIAPTDRLRNCSRLSSAVSIEDGIRRQQMDQILQFAALTGCKKSLGKFIS